MAMHPNTYIGSTLDKTISITADDLFLTKQAGGMGNITVGYSAVKTMNIEEVLTASGGTGYVLRYGNTVYIAASAEELSKIIVAALVRDKVSKK